MPLEPKRFREGVWIDWPAVKNVKLKIRPMTIRNYFELKARAKTKVAVHVPDPKPDNPEETKIVFVDSEDEYLFEWSSFDYALEAWEGLPVDATTKPTEKQIKEALFNHAGLRGFTLNTARKIGMAEEEKFEAELKNLGSSESG